MTLSSGELQHRLSSVRLLALDSDGVLTDGGVYISEEGCSFRRFDIKDGLGLRNLLDAALDVVILSSSPDKSVLRRAQTLGISRVYIGVQDKLAKLIEICQHLGVEMDQVCYMGDDLPDLPVMQVVGLACAPNNASPEVLSITDYICEHDGGFGAVREICDLILDTRL